MGSTGQKDRKNQNKHFKGSPLRDKPQRKRAQTHHQGIQFQKDFEPKGLPDLFVESQCRSSHLIIPSFCLSFLFTRANFNSSKHNGLVWVLFKAKFFLKLSKERLSRRASCFDFLKLAASFQLNSNLGLRGPFDHSKSTPRLQLRTLPNDPFARNHSQCVQV